MRRNSVKTRGEGCVFRAAPRPGARLPIGGVNEKTVLADLLGRLEIPKIGKSEVTRRLWKR